MGTPHRCLDLSSSARSDKNISAIPGRFNVLISLRAMAGRPIALVDLGHLGGAGVVARIPRSVLVLAIAASAACHPGHKTTTPTEPLRSSVQVGACAQPGRDGLVSAAPRLD